MGVQLILVVEADSRGASDWIYIKETIEHFYAIDNAHIKLTPLYMEGRGNYKKIQSKIKDKEKRYSVTAKNNVSHVIYCFDCDQYDKRIEDYNFLEEAKKYCKDNCYDFVWFCRDIEHVYLKKQIDSSEKSFKAEQFKNNNDINNITSRILSSASYKLGTSNLMLILDKYLKHKE